MGTLIAIVLGALAAIFICRLLASVFPAIRIIAWIAIAIFAIAIGVTNGFWYGVLVFVVLGIAAAILFGTGGDESAASRCSKCGSRDIILIYEGDSKRVTGYYCPHCNETTLH